MMNKETRIYGLRALIEEHTCAMEAFQWMAELKNRKSEITVTRLTRRTGCNRREGVAFLRALEGLDLGELTIGRRGHDTRLALGAHIADIGKAALGQIDRISLDYGVIDTDEILAMHRQLIAHALECEVEDVRIIVPDTRETEVIPQWPEDLIITVTRPGTSFEAEQVEGEAFDIFDVICRAPGNLEGGYHVVADAWEAISESDIERIEACMRYEVEWEGLIISIARLGPKDGDESRYSWDIELRERQDEDSDG